MRPFLIDLAGHDRLLPLRERLRAAASRVAGAARRIVGIARHRKLAGEGGIEGMLSVVVPAYGVERYIAACLDSLQRQNYRNIEIIVVDDGSPDRSGEIARRHGRQDARIRVVRRPNGGLSAARNTGAALARGEFITFIDSDDTVDRHAFTQAVESLRETGSDFAVAPYRRQYKTAYPPAAPWIQSAHAVSRRACTLEEFPEIQVNAVAWSKVYRRRFWVDAGLVFPEGALYEDQAVSSRAFARARAFDVLSRVSINWRVREDQSSISQQTASLRNIREHHRAVEQSLAELQNAGHLAARDARLAQLLTNNLTEFFVLIRAMAPEAWDAFASFVDYLIREVKDPAVWQTVDARSKVLAHLVARRDRTRSLAFLESSWERDRVGARLENGLLHAEFDVRQDLAAGVPDWAFVLAPRESEGHAFLSQAFVVDDEIVLDLIAYVDGFGAEGQTLNTSIELLSTLEDVRLPLDIERIDDPLRVHAHTLQYNDQRRSLLRVRIPLAGLNETADGYRIQVIMVAEGFERRAQLADSLQATEGRSFAALDLDGERTLEIAADDDDGIVIRVERPAAHITEARIARNRLRLHVNGNAVHRVAFVHLADRFGLRRNPTKTVPTPHGRTVDLRIPTFVGSPATGSGSGAATWIVVGEDGAGIWKPLHLNADAALVQGERYVLDRVGNVRHTPTGTVVPGGSLRVQDLAASSRITGFEVSDDAVRIQMHDRLSSNVIGDLVSGTRRLKGSVDDGACLIPLRYAPHGADEAPAPSGTYALEVPSGHVVLSPAVRALVPTTVRRRDHIVEVFLDDEERFCVRLAANLADDEIGPGNQNRLKAHFRGLSIRNVKRSVLFRSLYGEAANDSALAVHRRLRQRGNDLDLIWAVRDHSVRIPEGGRPVIEGSAEYYEAFRAADYLMVNVHQPDWVLKRPGQVFIQTFHGYPFKLAGRQWWKRLGFPPERIESFFRRAEDWDFLVSPAAYATPLLHEFFRDGQPGATALLEIGYPRNDALHGPDRTRIAESARRRLGIPEGKRAVLYAPTFRDYLSSDDMTAEHVELLNPEKLSRRLGEEYVFLVRGHPFHARAERSVAGSTIDVTDHPDINELILASDAAILDYSSLRFDYAQTGKPAVFFVPDRDRYFSERPSFLDFAPTAPGPIITDESGLLTQITDLDALRLRVAPQVERFRRTFTELEDGGAADRLIDAVFVPRGDAAPSEDGRLPGSSGHPTEPH